MTERDPLLPNTGTERRSATRWFSRKYLKESIDTEHSDIVLEVCCFVQGLCEAASFHNWSTFIGMQTGNFSYGMSEKSNVLCIIDSLGNTVLLALSTAGWPQDQPWAWLTTSVSLCSFFVGSMATAFVCRYFGSLQRGTLTGCFIFQAVLLALAASLAGSTLVPLNRINGPPVTGDIRIVTAIPPLAFQSGATIACSRMLGFAQEIPVTVLTSTYGALASDQKLLSSGNKPRDRRAIAVVLFFAGAVCSTWIMKTDSATADVIFWLSAGIKLLLAAVFVFFLKAEKP